MNYLGLNLSKYVQDMHAENYKMMTKEVKKYLINGDRYYAY